MKYINKKKVIEAFQLTASNMTFVENWCRGSIKGILLPVTQRVIDIQTLNGELRVSIGEYVIKDENGEFCTCAPDAFEKTYTPIN